MKLLIIEDEFSLLQSIQDYLQKQGYTCDIATDFKAAMEKIEFQTYDCIIVDISLPDGNGLNIIRELKEIDSPAGIIIISAKNSLEDKVSGLALGSDDYLTKPFHLSELNARVNAIIRRKRFDGSKFISFHEIHLETETRAVTVDQKIIDLTEKEYQLLLYLMENQRRVITKSAIAAHIWGSEYVQVGNYDFIYTHIKNLRKKLMDAGSLDYIKTLYGTGYRLVDY